MSGGDRLALVGASSVLGRDLKEQLARSGYPGDAVTLVDLDEQVGLLTEYGDEARVVVEAAEDNLRDFTVACFCGAPGLARRFAPVVVQAGGTAIDCTGAWGDSAEAQLIDASGAPEASGLLAVPHGGTLLLGQLSDALGAPFGQAIASLLLPASEGSHAGTDELARQATALLNFGGDSPDDVFGRRLAFDAWIDATPPRGGADLIGRQLVRLQVAAPAISAVRVSVFHAVAASVYLPGTDPAAVRSRLADTRVAVDEVDTDGLPIDSPARVAGSDDLHVTAIRTDAAGGTWLWAVLDNHHAVVRLALSAVAARLQPPHLRAV